MRIDNTDCYGMRPGETRFLTNAQNSSEWEQSNETKRIKESVQLMGKQILYSLQYFKPSRKSDHYNGHMLRLAQSLYCHENSKMMMKIPA